MPPLATGSFFPHWAKFFFWMLTQTELKELGSSGRLFSPYLLFDFGSERQQSLSAGQGNFPKTVKKPRNFFGMS